TCARGAGETVEAGDDRRASQWIRRDTPKIERLSVATLQVEHLVEVAIVNLTAVTNADRCPAHQIFNCRRVEIVGEQFKIRIPFTAFAEVFSKTRDRLICDCVKRSEERRV